MLYMKSLHKENGWFQLFGSILDVRSIKTFQTYTLLPKIILSIIITFGSLTVKELGKRSLRKQFLLFRMEKSLSSILSMVVFLDHKGFPLIIHF